MVGWAYHWARATAPFNGAPPEVFASWPSPNLSAPGWLTSQRAGDLRRGRNGQASPIVFFSRPRVYKHLLNDVSATTADHASCGILSLRWSEAPPWYQPKGDADRSRRYGARSPAPSPPSSFRLGCAWAQIVKMSDLKDQLLRAPLAAYLEMKTPRDETQVKRVRISQKWGRVRVARR
jgi:hypothetical protein